MQSITSQTGQGICGSSLSKQIGLVVDIPFSIPVELTWGVDDIEIDSMGMVLVVIIGVVVAINVFSGIVLVSLPEVDGPPFNNGTCSIMISGSLVIIFLLIRMLFTSCWYISLSQGKLSRG